MFWGRCYVKRIGVVKVNEHDLGVTLGPRPQPLEGFADGGMGHLVLPSALEFIRTPKCSIDKGDVNAKLAEPFPN